MLQNAYWYLLEKSASIAEKEPSNCFPFLQVPQFKQFFMLWGNEPAALLLRQFKQFFIILGNEPTPYRSCRGLAHEAVLDRVDAPRRLLDLLPEGLRDELLHEVAQHALAALFLHDLHQIAR